MPSFLRQGNLPNRASKIKRLLARHDIHLPRANVKVEVKSVLRIGSAHNNVRAL
jgi:hypothetical protein